MFQALHIIGRTNRLFTSDLLTHSVEMRDLVEDSRFLVIGGAGTIGQAVVKEIFKRNPAALHVVDISENNLVELVRDVRSSLGYGEGDFKTLPLDVNSPWFDSFADSEKPYDYVLNLSALKHVRSEKDPFTLMRLLEVNIFNTVRTAERAATWGARKYFAVSTDKAANPVNLMGGSKRLMEKFLYRASHKVPVSTARFANVAFSDGSLLHGFNQRLLKSQPLSAPSDVKRYFLLEEESGELCLLSALLGGNLDVFFPKLSSELNLITFAEIARRYLEFRGYEPFECSSEEEARARVGELAAEGKWPVHFFESDTTGEKPFEEFYMVGERLEMDRFESVGVVKNEAVFDDSVLAEFECGVARLRNSGSWTKAEIVSLMEKAMPELEHEEKGRYLDQRM